MLPRWYRDDSSVELDAEDQIAMELGPTLSGVRRTVPEVTKTRAVNRRAAGHFEQEASTVSDRKGSLPGMRLASRRSTWVRSCETQPGQ